MNEPCIQKEDLEILLPLVEKLKPKAILEIGTYKGGSATMWKNKFKPKVLITVDIERLAKLKNCNYLTGLPSQDPRVFEQISNILGGREIDLLFIDGDHNYEAVKRDFEIFEPLVRPGGMIVFHDILYRYDDGDVPKLWKEIKRNYNYIEIAQNHDTTGVGVITKGRLYERTYHGNIT